jgi:hypothetical protein
VATAAEFLCPRHARQIHELRIHELRKIGTLAKWFDAADSIIVGELRCNAHDRNTLTAIVFRSRASGLHSLRALCCPGGRVTPLLKEMWHNPLLWLLALVPVVLAVQAFKPDAHTLLFVLSVAAIAPLSRRFGGTAGFDRSETSDTFLPQWPAGSALDL